MLATLRAQKLIVDSGLLDSKYVFTNNIPEEFLNDLTHDVCLITEVRNDIALPGNEDFHAFNREIEVQIFYRLEADDPSELESKLLHRFVQANWSVIDNRGHSVDPDTKQLTVTWYFDYFDIEKEGKN